MNIDFKNVSESVGLQYNASYTSSGQKLKSIKLFLKKSAPILIISVFLIIVLFSVKKVVQSGSGTQGSSSTQFVAKTLAKTKVGREFEFPLKDAKGVTVSKFKYFIESAEIKNQIVVNGKNANAVPGRTFLLVTLKITNVQNRSLQINSKDYMRLSVNRNEREWLAADIHNDPVEAQPISTKYTRIGFIINETDRNLVLQIGEIDGVKQKVPLNFK